jgi:hypothetical protein
MDPRVKREVDEELEARFIAFPIKYSLALGRAIG